MPAATALCSPDAPLRDRLAQLIVVRIGSNMSPIRTVEEDEERVAELLKKCSVGGLVAFNGSFARTPGTLRRLQHASRYPLLISADLERGLGQQLHGYPLFPHAMAFDALGADAAAAVRQFGELTAAASRAAGVHILDAPVADVNSDPRNPIIATRAFGTQPDRVAELVMAMVEGCRAGGALAVAKHFPGHGNTHEDSHHTLPTVNAPREVIAARDLPPFRAAIAAGVPMVMTAHVSYPALDPTGVAATVSRPILQGLLRDELGFKGAIVTDSLLMAGATLGAADEGELLVNAVAAGVDLLLDVADPIAGIDALEAAVAAGDLSEERVNDACTRVQQLKIIAGLGPRRATGSASAPGTLAEPVGHDEGLNRRLTEALADDVARRATVVLKDDRSLLPLDPQRSLSAILVNPFPRPAGVDPPCLGELLRRRFPRLSYFELGAEPSSEQFARAAEAALAGEQLLAAFIVKPAAWRQFGLPGALSEWLQNLAFQRPMVAACLGAPQGLEAMSAATSQLCTFSDVPASQQALVDRLVGLH